MPQENEVKIALQNVKQTRRLLLDAGFRVHRARVFEQNIVLDDAKGSVKKRGLLLRLRAAGKVVTCTFKGAEVPGIHKRREEVEFHADHLENCLAVFAGLGYMPGFRYEKYRTEFTREGEPGTVTIDELSIGNFMELEGPARWLDRTAKELDYSRADYITLSYGKLFEQWDNEA